MKKTPEIKATLEFYIDKRCEHVSLELTKTQFSILEEAINLAHERAGIDIELLDDDSLDNLH